MRIENVSISLILTNLLEQINEISEIDFSKIMNKNQNDTKYIQDLCREIAEEFIYTHARINANSTRTLEAASCFYALFELLEEKGIVSREELDEKKKQIAGRLDNLSDTGLGLLYAYPEQDKYEYQHEGFEDCLNRLEICKAKCCKIPFTLSRQDVEEGIVRWEFSRPYLIAHGDDGYCVHLDRNSYKCTIRNNRPFPCRHFVCKDNEKWKLWIDYENKLLNNEIFEQIEKSNEKIYACLDNKRKIMANIQ